MQELDIIWNKNVFQNYTLVGEKAAYFKCNLHPKGVGLGSLHVVIKFILTHPHLPKKAVVCAISHAIY